MIALEKTQINLAAHGEAASSSRLPQTLSHASVSSNKSKSVAHSNEQTAAARKLRLLRRAGLFGTDTKGTTISRATSLEELRQAYRVVHDVYLKTGFIAPEPAGIRLRIFETSSETATFVAKKDGEIVGVLSVVGDSADLGLPSDSAFNPELDGLRLAGKKLCELTNQAVTDEYRSSAVPTELMRCAIAHAVMAGYHATVATVSPSHNGFYDLIGFKLFGQERSYSAKLHDPVIAMSICLDAFRRPASESVEICEFIHNFAVDTNPYLGRVADWSRKAKAAFLNPELLEGLFVNQRNFLSECTVDEIESIKLRWGRELYSAVSGVYTSPELEEWMAVATSRNPENIGRTEAPFSAHTKEAAVEKIAADLHHQGERLRAWYTRVASRITQSNFISTLTSWVVPSEEVRTVRN